MADGAGPTKTTRYRGALSSYLRQIRGYPLLTASGERRAASKSLRGEKSARQTLVQSNLRLVVHIARDYAASGAPMEDLIGEGNIGLIEAARRFDPSRGARFVTYASWWIRKYVLAALNRHRAQSSVPMARGAETSGDRSGEVSGRLLVLWRRVLSFSEFRHQDDRTPAEIRIASKDPAPEQQVQDLQAAEVLHDVLCQLSPREREILTSHYGLNGAPPESLQAIAERQQCTREWVRQIERHAIERVRRILECRGFRV